MYDNSKHTDQDRGQRGLVMMYRKQAQYVVAARGQLVVVDLGKVQDSEQQLFLLRKSMVRQSVMASL